MIYYATCRDPIRVTLWSTIDHVVIYDRSRLDSPCITLWFIVGSCVFHWWIRRDPSCETPWFIVGLVEIFRWSCRNSSSVTCLFIIRHVVITKGHIAIRRGARHDPPWTKSWFTKSRIMSWFIVGFVMQYREPSRGTPWAMSWFTQECIVFHHESHRDAPKTVVYWLLCRDSQWVKL